MSSSTSILFLFFSLISISQPTRACFSSIISFGGSPSDNGNELTDLLREINYRLYVGFLPNGQTFFGYPTGRFCDGRIVNDFIAEELGLPHPPPHMSGAGPENQYFKYGVNVAIAGSTLAETSFFLDRGTATPFSHSISAEVQWFKDLLPIYCSSASDCGQKLADALFIVGPFARNDFRTEYLHHTSDDEIKTVVIPVMVDGFISALKELVDIGARTMIVPNSYPIGCLPASFIESPRDDIDEETGCMNWLNDITSLFHRQFEAKLQVFQSEYPYVTILYADLYGKTVDMIRSPEKYGIEGKPLVTCCGEGGGPYNYNATARCGEEGAKKACDDPSKALFWDGVHLTEARYKHIATELVKELLALPSIKEQCKDLKRKNDDEPFFM